MPEISSVKDAMDDGQFFMSVLPEIDGTILATPSAYYAAAARDTGIDAAMPPAQVIC